MTEVWEVLEKAADLLERPGAWTQGSYARDDSRRREFPHSDYAVCWCAVGAIARVHGERFASSVLEGPEIQLLQSVVGRSVVLWNDAPGRTQAEVVTALRKAALLAKEAGQ